MYDCRVTVAMIERCRHLLMGVFLAAILVGCGSTPTQPEPLVLPAPVQEVTQTPPRDILKELLFAGLTALDNDHLSEPRQGSAADYFGQVLDVDPDNAIALEGMQRLVARYMALAEQAFKQGARSVAEGYLYKAEPYAKVAGIAGQLQTVRQCWASKPTQEVKSNAFLLDETALNERNEAILWRLTEIAVKAMRAKSRITIVSRNDAEGRWIYQQMREVLAEYRLRGNIVQGKEPKIILVDL